MESSLSESLEILSESLLNVGFNDILNVGGANDQTLTGINCGPNVSSISLINSSLTELSDRPSTHAKVHHTCVGSAGEAISSFNEHVGATSLSADNRETNNCATDILSESLMNLSLDEIGDSPFRPLLTSTPAKNKRSTDLHDSSQPVKDHGNIALELDYQNEPKSPSPPNVSDMSLSCIDDETDIAASETERVTATLQKQKRSQQYISLKYKQKIVESDVAFAMRAGCCPKRCVRNLNTQFVKDCRKMYWRKKCHARRQWLLDRIGQFKDKGKTSYITLTPTLDVCRDLFIRIYGLSRSTFFNTKKAFKKGSIAANPTEINRRQTEKTLTAVFWLEKHASHYGDRMPHKNEILLPLGTNKCDVYDRYKEDAEALNNTAISKSHFMKTWKSFLPHLKIKQQMREYLYL